MNLAVLAPLGPVIAVTALGFAAGRLGWLGPQRVRTLSNIVFTVLTPALLFRTMGKVDVAHLDFRPVASYFVAVVIIFAATLALLGFNRRAAVLALANTYSNNVMIGIPLIGLAYGQAGLVALFTLVSVHALVLLTTGTIVLELALLREEHVHASRSTMRTVLVALRNGVIHPVPLPIIAGLVFSSLGFTLPTAIDKPLQWLGLAFGPLALILVGATLAATRIRGEWRGALSLALVKNFVHPALVAAIAWWMVPGTVARDAMIVAAALPVGANVFLFSQRYGVAEDTVTAAVAMSTLLAVPSLAIVLWLLA
jgi:malonate transporter and related proteins